MTFGS